jgi:hypothetical protein
MTDEYDPEVNVMPMIAAIRCFGEAVTEATGSAEPGDYRITFGRLLIACADGMHMDSLNGTLKRARFAKRVSTSPEMPALYRRLSLTQPAAPTKAASCPRSRILPVCRLKTKTPRACNRTARMPGRGKIQRLSIQG